MECFSTCQSATRAQFDGSVQNVQRAEVEGTLNALSLESSFSSRVHHDGEGGVCKARDIHATTVGIFGARKPESPCLVTRQ